MLFVPIKLICFVVVTKRICSTLNADRHLAVPTKVPTTRKLRTVWKLQHWRTTNFVGNVILIKKKNSFNSFKFHFNFVSIHVVIRFMWLYQDWLDIHLNRNFAENCKYFFRFYSFLFHNRLSLELSPKI